MTGPMVAWFDDYDTWRETRAWQHHEDALEREEREQARAETERYVAEDVRLPLLPRRGTT